MRGYFICMLFMLSGCAALTDGDYAQLSPVSFAALPGWAQDDHAEALRLFAESCPRAQARNKTSAAPIGEAHQWKRICAKAKAAPQARQFFEAHFQPHRVRTHAQQQGLFTGYYEPLLRGSMVRTARYTEPVYAVPRGLKPRDATRAEIDAGALNARADVLLYVDDPVMLFFTHIQGSGKVQLASGGMVSLQFAAKNGHDYVPIGRVLRERGLLTQVSLQTIREWLYAHPESMREILHTNPTYVFFELAPGDAYPKGALGIPLTPLRSLAIDNHHAAYGLPIYVDVPISGASQTALRRLMISQDTGSALKGAHRGDIFFGRGAQAEQLAGEQNARGDVFWLLPKAQP